MSNRQLTDLQQAVVDFLWKAGPSTAEQVREGLAPTHELKDSTIRTLLRLEDRDYLTHTVDGKVFVYRAVRPADHRALLVGIGRAVPRRNGGLPIRRSTPVAATPA